MIYLIFTRSIHIDRKDENIDRNLQYQRESPKMASAPPPTQQHLTSGAGGHGSGGSSSAASGGGDSTLTAASLIDAIITHQINQTSATPELGPPGSKPSSVDQLFNRYRRNPSPGSESRSGPPPKERHREDSPSSLPPSQPQRPPSSSPSPASQLPMGSATNRTTFTLGEHIESIIAKDFHQGASGPGGPISGVMNEQDLEREWHRRQAAAAAADYPHKSRMPAPESMANDYSKQSRAVAAAAAVAAAQSRE